MRFMMMVRANKDTEAGLMPGEQLIAAMTKYNEEMARAGVLLDLAGLQLSSKGARINFSANGHTVIDGPFAETKELIAGYWLIKVNSKEEAIEWAKRCPAPHGRGAEGEIELRQVFELEDSARARRSKMRDGSKTSSRKESSRRGVTTIQRRA